jgi:HD-GYP domain-containing protein (c-di-GMP phosphodiesterase class II)
MNYLEKSQKTFPWEEMFVLSLYRLIQAIRIHEDNNAVVKDVLGKFRQIISKTELEDDLTVLISEGRFYIHGERLQYRKDLVRIIHALLVFFKQRSLHGLLFHLAFREATYDEIITFMRLLILSAQHELPPDWLKQQLTDKGILWVSLVNSEDLKPNESDPNIKEKARDTYFNAIAAVKQVSQKISTQGFAGVRKAKRMIQSMVDVALQDEDILMGLGTIKDYDDYTYTHSVNVAVLSLCLGNRIGLSRTSLERLGICGLFHDLGKVEVPREIVNKPGALNDMEWKEIQKHPLSSVRQILKLQASHDLKSEILLAPFEHHIRHDLSGYPKVHFIKEVSLFGRILHITDVYDALTSPRVYRPATFSPDQALSHMIEGAGTDFDPILLKVFAMMMGTYPPGTLLQFDNGEIGLVTDYPFESGGKLPRVVLLERDTENGIKRGHLVDLADKDPVTGEYVRKTLRSLNPTTYGIQPADYII